MRRFIKLSGILSIAGTALALVSLTPSPVNAGDLFFTSDLGVPGVFATETEEDVISRNYGEPTVQLASHPYGYGYRSYSYRPYYGYRSYRPYYGRSIYFSYGSYGYPSYGSYGYPFGYSYYSYSPRYYSYGYLRPYYFSYSYPTYAYPSYYPSYVSAFGCGSCYRPSYSYYHHGFDYGGYCCPPATCCAPQSAAPPETGLPPTQPTPQPEAEPQPPTPEPPSA